MIFEYFVLSEQVKPFLGSDSGCLLSLPLGAHSVVLATLLFDSFDLDNFDGRGWDGLLSLYDLDNGLLLFLLVFEGVEAEGLDELAGYKEIA